MLWLITWLGYISIRLIGRTLRYSVRIEEGGPSDLRSRPLILCFWHEGIFVSTYVFRDQKIGVISSHSFDGEYTGRIISIANLREGDEVAVLHVPKANVPLGDGVKEPTVYPEVEAMLGKPIAEYALA